MKQLSAKHPVLALILACGCGVAAASPLTYTFAQKGFESVYDGQAGGVVTGSFTGEDLNGDGYLALRDGEITAYSASYSGNAEIQPFTHALPELQYLSYAIGSSGFGQVANPGIRFLNFVNSAHAELSYDIDDQLIFIGELGSGPIYYTRESAFVTAVPEPAMPLLLLAGLLPLAYLGKRRRSSL
jgi:hypothetical protein